MDSQSVKTVEESARIRGSYAHTCSKGRKRHLLGDTLGLPIAWYVTPADLQQPWLITHPFQPRSTCAQRSRGQHGA